MSLSSTLVPPVNRGRGDQVLRPAGESQWVQVSAPSGPGKAVSTVDCIRLKDMTLFARLGVTSWEKEAVQKVSVDVDLYLDLSDATREDSINAALNYQEAYEVVQHVGREKKYHLIEALAHEITSALMSRFASLSSVRVRVRKTRLPFDAHLDCVEVELERRR